MDSSNSMDSRFLKEMKRYNIVIVCPFPVWCLDSVHIGLLPPPHKPFLAAFFFLAFLVFVFRFCFYSSRSLLCMCLLFCVTIHDCPRFFIRSVFLCLRLQIHVKYVQLKPRARMHETWKVYKKIVINRLQSGNTSQQQKTRRKNVCVYDGLTTWLL